MSKRKEIDKVVLRTRLIKRRSDLIRFIDGHHEETRPVQLDQTKVGRLSRMDEIQTQAMSIETERRRKEEILRINSALYRMEIGEYGDCVICGDNIELKRIEIDPATPTCVSCAK